MFFTEEILRGSGIQKVREEGLQAQKNLPVGMKVLIQVTLILSLSQFLLSFSLFMQLICLYFVCLFSAKVIGSNSPIKECRAHNLPSYCLKENLPFLILALKWWRSADTDHSSAVDSSLPL